MSRSDLGTKRIDPETGKKFYDLNRDPVVSPYTGISYPLSYFEVMPEVLAEEDDIGEELDTVLEKTDFISLEDTEIVDKELDDMSDLDEATLHDADTADHAFLTVEDEDDDMSDLVITDSLDEDL
ncbi:TIGR02300 family protein [Bartonella sp. DGB1]|uniref:TIGR02300 family protein n=1 Tax=Bartonella sp. DGB1 TaxID=3239807 RepID=UPI0035243173